MSYISSHTGTAIDDAINLVEIIFNKMYPIGAIYMSADSTNPSALFGGTWEQITDKILMCAGSSYAAGTSGGAATHTHTSAAHTHTTAAHTLTISQIPSHTHATYGQVPRINDSSVSGTVYGHTTDEQSWWFKSVASEVKAAGGGGSHSHGNTGSTTPGNTGSNSNLPPYLTVYCWKRTA